MNPLKQRTLDRADETDLLPADIQEVGEEVQHQSQESPSLVIARLLWQERIRLCKGTLAALLISVVISFLIPVSYTATVQLMPPDSSALSGDMGMLAALMNSSSTTGSAAASGGLASGIGELLGGQRPGALFVGILGSRTIADRIIDKFDLRKVYWRKTYVATRKKLASNTDIAENKKTGIISIEVQDHDRSRAVGIAQAYVSELDRLMAQVNTSAASREREFLEQRLVLVHQDLQVSSKELSKFSSENTTLDPEEQGKAMVEAAAVLQGQLIAAQSELSGLEQIYTSENARVRSLRANVAELQQELDKLGGKNYTGKTTLDPDSLYPSLRQLPILTVQYAELYRRVKIDETVFEMLTKEYELAKVEEAKETPSVKVLDAARLPEKPSWPPRKVLTLIGGFLGFLVVSCRVVGQQYWSELDSDEPHKQFIQAVWADIRPYISKRGGSLILSKISLLGANSRQHSDN